MSQRDAVNGLQRCRRVDQQQVHLATPERPLQAGSQPKLKGQALGQDLRALHQHIDVTAALGVIGAGAKQQHARLVTHDLTGQLADGGLVLR